MLALAFILRQAQDDRQAWDVWGMGDAPTLTLPRGGRGFLFCWGGAGLAGAEHFHYGCGVSGAVHLFDQFLGLLELVE